MHALRIFALVAAALVLSACADKRITLKYDAPTALAPIAHAQPLTIYTFNDRRGDEGDNDPMRVGGVYGGYGNRLSKVMADGPFMQTLVNALADAFKARGVPVTVVAGPFSAGSGSTPGPVLSGDLKNFSTEARYTNSAHISAIVRLYAPAGGVLVEKELSERLRSDQGGGAGVLTDVKDLERIMNETLGKFAQRVVNDPDIAGRLAGPQ